MNEKSAKRILALIIAFVMMLCLGLIYAWSIFVVPLETEFGWTRDKTSLTFMISMICFCIGGVFDGKQLIRGRSFRTMLFASAILMVIGFLAASTTTQLWQFYLFYGVFCGFGVGMAYNAVISTITDHFVKNSGTVSGTLMMGFGLGALIFGVVCTKIMEAFGWRTLFIGIGIVFGVVFLLGTAALYQAFKKDSPALPQEAVSEAKPDVSFDPGRSKTYGLGLSQVLRRPEFWLLFCWIFLFGSCGLSLIGNVAPATISMGATATTAGLFTGIVSLFNGVGRSVAGTCFDRFGYKRVAIVVSIGFFVAIALLLASTNLGNLGLFFAACALTGFCFSALPVSCAAFMMKQYGPPHFAENFGAGNTNMLVQAVIGSGIFAAFLTQRGNDYSEGFLLLIPLAIAGLIVYGLLIATLRKGERAGNR
ncbi:MAG: MFS transporter [Clostridiales Family XIII bacterium]|jgi:OFA family oxalate/formate antiporter-like MFS transporter|nr:MFS transporter [Clostridiales Family XIII bacterium]